MYIDKLYTKLFSNKDWKGLGTLVSEIRTFNRKTEAYLNKYPEAANDIRNFRKDYESRLRDIRNSPGYNDLDNPFRQYNIERAQADAFQEARDNSENLQGYGDWYDENGYKLTGSGSYYFHKNEADEMRQRYKNMSPSSNPFYVDLYTSESPAKASIQNIDKSAATYPERKDKIDAWEAEKNARIDQFNKEHMDSVNKLKEENEAKYQAKLDAIEKSRTLWDKLKGDRKDKDVDKARKEFIDEKIRLDNIKPNKHIDIRKEIRDSYRPK